MRLLLLSYYYAPLVSPRAFRWSAVAEKWAAQGHEITVLAAWKPGLERREVVEGVRVERVGSALSAAVRARLLAGGPANGSGHPRKSPIVQAGWRQGVRWLYERSWKRLYWPDFAWGWYRPALQAASRLWRAEPYDGLVSISDPFTVQFVGWALARRFQIGNWIADVGDPFCFLYRDLVRGPQVLKRLDVACERRIYARAKAIAFTTEGTRRRYAELFPASAPKMHVIPPLAPALPGAPTDARIFPADDKIRLVYAGSFYPQIRTPEPLLRLFEQLRETALGPRLEMHVFGAIAGYESYFLNHRSYLSGGLFLHGQSPREYVLQACREATAIINLGNRTPFQLPSKIVEYAQLRKPIINLTTIPDDSSQRFLDGYPAAVSVRADGRLTPESVALVERFLESPPRLAGSFGSNWTAQFAPAVIAEQYERLLTDRARPAHFENKHVA